MRIEASYLDGFTERLLSWDLEINNGKAYLEAKWSGSLSPHRARFRFDDRPFRSALPSLSDLEETYQAAWNDLESRDLVVVDGETTLRRHVYGAGVLVQEPPEIRRFLDVWRLLDDAVLAHLPSEFQG